MQAVGLEVVRQSKRGQTRVLATSKEPTERASVEQGGVGTAGVGGSDDEGKGVFLLELWGNGPSSQ